MSYVDEYLMFKLIDFDNMKMLRFWSLHLFAMESGQRNASLCVMKGKHLRFKLLKDENYPDGVAVHIQYFLESIKTMSHSTDSERGDVDKWMPLMASQNSWSCASRTLLYYLCRKKWIKGNFDEMLNNVQEQVTISAQYNEEYVFGRFDDEIERCSKGFKTADISVSELEKLVTDDKLSSIERYQSLSNMMEQFDPKLLPLTVTNALYHKMSKIIRPGQQPWTSYSARRTLNTRIKSIAFITGEESKSEISRIMLGHTRDSKIHDGYMDNAALTTTNMTAFSRMEDMSKVSTITDSILDTDLSKCDEVYSSLNIVSIPTQMSSSIETFAQTNECTIEMAEHKLGLILCGGQEYSVESTLKREKQSFKPPIIRFFLDESKKHFLNQDSQLNQLIDNDEKRVKRQLVARKLLTRTVLKQGGLSIDINAPDYLIKRAFDLKSKLKLNKKEMYDALKEFLDENNLIDSDNCIMSDATKDFLKQEPVISLHIDSQPPVKEQQEEDEKCHDDEKQEIIAEKLIYPLEWFSLDQLKGHEQCNDIFNMVRGLSDYKNWQQEEKLNLKPFIDQLEVILPCKSLNKVNQYYQLFTFVNHMDMDGDKDSDEKVVKVIDNMFQSPLSTDFYSLPHLIQCRLVTLVENHVEFHQFIKRLIEDNVTDIVDQKKFLIGRVATMINVEEVSKLLVKMEKPARAYAGVFMTVLKRIDKQRTELELIDKQSNKLNITAVKQWVTQWTESQTEEEDDDENNAITFPLMIDGYDELNSRERTALQNKLINEKDFIHSLRDLRDQMIGCKNFKVSSRTASSVQYKVSQQYVVRKTETKQSYKPSITRMYYAQLYLSMARDLGWVKRGSAWVVESIPPPPKSPKHEFPSEPPSPKKIKIHEQDTSVQ